MFNSDVRTSVIFLRGPYKISVRFNDTGELECSLVASGSWKIEALRARWKR